MTLRIGIDFDNTMVCYDRIFSRVAREQNLIPPDLPESKSHVRDYLRKSGREDEWTKLQGYVYGARMNEADAFPGVLEFFEESRGWDVVLFIISHKTKSPYLGPHYDLHQTARDWIAGHGFYDPSLTRFGPEQVFFELTKEAKIQRIADVDCSVFLDDLPEFLAETNFPRQTERVLFDPAGIYDSEKAFPRVHSWDEFADYVLKKLKKHE